MAQVCKSPFYQPCLCSLALSVLLPRRRARALCSRVLLLLLPCRERCICKGRLRALRLNSSEHDSETYEQFNERYVKFFEGVEDQFEAQRGLNNAFAHDLVPSGEVIEAALRAARRVNDYALATRVFEGIKFKVENQGQYKQYLEALAPVREELGISLKEELFVN